VITGTDADVIAKTDAAWKKKVDEDEKNAKKQQCNVATMLTGEQSYISYLENCVGFPTWAKYAAFATAGLVGFLALKKLRVI
jgi:hypothetical protein